MGIRSGNSAFVQSVARTFLLAVIAGLWAAVLWSLRGDSSSALAAEGTTTGNAVTANLTLGLLGTTALAGNAVPRQASARVSLCVERLRLIPSERNEPPVEVALSEGTMALASSLPFSVGSFRVPPGVYREIRLLVANRCGGTSVVVDNGAGQFGFREPVELVWRIPAEVTALHRPIWLPVDSLLRRAEAVRSEEGLGFAIRGGNRTFPMARRNNAAARLPGSDPSPRRARRLGRSW